MSKKDKASYVVIEDGFRAEAILSDPVFQEAMETLEAKWVTAWRRSDDAETRERYWALTKALEGVKDELKQIQTNGEIEASKSRRISTR